jgi:hypothetical protein
MVAGQSEFGFSFISAPETIDNTLNRGAGLIGAGPVNLRGTQDSWHTPLAADTADFDCVSTDPAISPAAACHRYVRNGRMRLRLVHRRRSIQVRMPTACSRRKAARW